MSTIISNASKAESSECTHFGFFVITVDTNTSTGFTNWEITRRVMSLSVMMPDKAPSASSNKAASTRFDVIFDATSKIVDESGIVTGALSRSLLTGRSFDLEAFMAVLGILMTELVKFDRFVRFVKSEKTGRVAGGAGDEQSKRPFSFLSKSALFRRLDLRRFTTIFFFFGCGDSIDGCCP